jgi:hypothetical protein
MDAADGTSSTPLYIVTDASMDPEEFRVIKVPGLCSDTRPKSFGYLGFLSKRAGNKAFFNWLFQNFIVEFVDECREAQKELSKSLNEYHINELGDNVPELEEDEDAEGQMFAMTFDGEQKQMEPLMDPDNSELRDYLKEKRILAIKHPASSSSKLQATNCSSYGCENFSLTSALDRER